MKYFYFVSHVFERPLGFGFGYVEIQTDRPITSVNQLIDIANKLIKRPGKKDNPVILNFQLLRTEDES